MNSLIDIFERFCKIFRTPLFRALLITASVIYFHILYITLVCRIWHKYILNIWSLNLFRCIALIFVKELYTNVSEIIIYKKGIYYFEEMCLKHLAMQFFEESFLMVFWCTTISFFGEGFWETWWCFHTIKRHTTTFNETSLSYLCI